MKNEVIKMINKVFFYSSRQVIRRRKSYTSVFITSIVLLACVMTFLEFAESYTMRDVQRNMWGTHHALIRGMYNDFSEDIETHKRVESTFVIPYTSLLESSDDTSIVGRVCVETEEIDEYLSVKYIWGGPPKDGEIAVSNIMYRTHGYLIAGEENDLYFKSSVMTYYPLKVSGIYECSFADSKYVFVSENTAKAIAEETNAKEKYDIYIRCKSWSDRYISQVINDIYEMCKFPDTEWQSRSTDDYSILTSWGQYLRIYRDYINSGYMNYVINYNTTPVLAICLPVIAAAALMLASFVGNWMISNSPEYGVLGAIGANRRHLCAISAGQVLFISILASVPVILLSAAVSNIYISVYNSISSTDVDYVFSIPWGKLIQASLWFDILACFFTYLTVAKITREYPFILISGSFRSSYPFVKRSAYTIEKSKDKIRKISLVRAMRNIKSEIITAIVTSLICIVCGAFFLIIIVVRGVAGMNLSELQDHASDMQITVEDAYASPAELMAMGRIKRALIKHSDMEYLRSVDGVVSVGAYYEGRSKTPRPDDSGKYIISENPTIITDEELDTHYYMIADDIVLPHLYKYVIAGDPFDLFGGDNKVIVFSRDHETTYKVGDKMEISAGYEQKRSTGKIIPGETHEFTVAAVVAEQSEDFLKLGDNTFIFSFEGGEKLGFIENGEAEGLIVDLDESFTYEDITNTVDTIVNSPQILRYDVVNYTVASTQERQIEATNTLLVTMFFVMVYLSFCVMTYTSSYLKVTKMRQEIAITRQIGADNRAIYKTMRTESYPTSILAIIITFAIILLISYVYKSYSMWFLNAQADMYPLSYPEEYYNEVKSGINQVALIILVLLPAALPMHLISFAVSVLGTVLPTKQLLKETITDGIRKDTD